MLGRVLGLLSLAVAVALFQFTQTETGRNAAIVLLQGALDNAVDGEVRIGPVIGGNLVTRTVLGRFEIADSSGRIFVALDTVTLEYDPFSLLRRQLRIRRLDARRAEIRLVQGLDGRWNFERIFGKTDAPSGATPGDSEGDGRPLRLVLGDVTMRDGSLEIRMPWTERLEGSARDRALREARADASVWYVEETAAGEFERVYRVEDMAGQFPSLRIIDPPHPLEIALENVSGRVLMVRQPLDVTSFSGAVTFGDTIRVEIDRFETAGSNLEGTGWLVGGSPLAYRFDLRADPIAFQDLAWLPVPVPARGGGPMEIELESRGATPFVTVRNGSVESDGTALRGGFRIALERTPRFESLDIVLGPLRLAWLDDLLGRERLIDGLVRGTVRGSGRIDAFDIDADIALEDLMDPAPPSLVSVRGGVAIVEPFPLRTLELGLEAFEPRWARILGIESDIPGRVAGTVTIDRPDGGILAFQGAISHTTPGGDVSRLSGAGTFDFAEGSLVNVSVDARPLALAALRPWVPDLELVGTVSGPIRASGTLSSLRAEADLVTPRGLLRLDGLFGLDGDLPRYEATIDASDIALDQWLENAPASRLAIRGRVNGVGIDPATMNASFDLEILPSEFERVEIESMRLRFEVEDGLVEIDTMIIRTDVGSMSGRGRFGLAGDRVGTLEFEVEVADLSEWNRWVAEEIPGGRAANAGEQLFADFASAIAAPPPGERVEGLLGAASARGVVIGTVSDFSVEAFVDGRDVRFETWGADSITARIQLADPPRSGSVVGRLTAIGAVVNGISLDSLDIEFERRLAGPVDLGLYARRDSTIELAVRGLLEVRDGGFAAALHRIRVRFGKLESSLLEPTRVEYSDSALVIEGLAISGTLGRVEADGVIPAVGDGDLAIRVTGVRVDQLGYLFSDAPQVGGTFDATGAISGSLSEPRMRGTLRILDPAVGDHRYGSLDARFEYSDRRLDGSVDLTRDGRRLARVEGNVRADFALLPVERRLLEEPLDLRVQADSLPLQLLELRVRGLEDIEGIAIGSVTMSGEPGELRYGGDLRITGGEAWVPDLGIRMVRVEGRAVFRDREARLDSIVLSSALGGSVRITGQLDLSTLSDPAFDLDIEARRLHAIARRDIDLAIGGTGNLAGRYSAPRLTGRFRLSDGDIRQDEFLRERQVLDLSDPQFYSLLDSAAVRERGLLDRFRNRFMDNLQIDVDLDLGPNLWLRSPILNVEMLAEGLDVTMDRARDELLIVGGVELARGTYQFDRIPPYVQSLRITSGTIQFVGTPEFNPNLAITAEYRNRTVDGPVVVEARIGGTLLNTDLTLTSNPPMSQTDQLCFLAVGAPCVGAADRQLGQRLFQEFLLGTLSSGLSSALVGSTGLSYFNLRSIGGTQTTGTTVQGSQSLFDFTAVEFGWYASQDLFFTFQQPLGGGPPRATLEWRFRPSWTLEAKASSRFDDRLYGLFRNTNFVNERTFGLFLFREWSF